MLFTVSGLAAAAIVVVVVVVVVVVDDGDDDKLLKHAPALAQKNWLAFGMLLDSILSQTVRPGLCYQRAPP